MVEGGTLSQKEFAEWGKDYVLFCHITSRVEGEKHGDLLSEKGGQGFPHFVYMDAEGNVLAVHERDRSVAAFGASAEDAKANMAKLADLAAKSAAGDAAAKKERLDLRLTLGHLDLAAANAALAELTLADDEKKTYAGRIANLEVNSILASFDGSQAAREAAGDKFKAMLEAGRTPAGESEVQPFCMFMMDAAVRDKDAVTYELALEIIRQRFGSNPQAQQFIAEREKVLAELKGGAGK